MTLNILEQKAINRRDWDLTTLASVTNGFFLNFPFMLGLQTLISNFFGSFLDESFNEFLLR